MKKGSSKPVKLPADWQQAFKTSNIHVGLKLNLSRTMLEFLCAVADDCDWDRASFGDIHTPDSWYCTAACLEKRGLIYDRRPTEEMKSVSSHNWSNENGSKDRYERDYRSLYGLTPAGQKVVELLKVVGIFIEHDTATRRRSRRA